MKLIQIVEIAVEFDPDPSSLAERPHVCCFDTVQPIELGTAECNVYDGFFFNSMIAYCNSNEKSESQKRDYVCRRIPDYEHEVKARTNGRHVDILFQKEERKRELEDFRDTPTPAKAKELLKYFLPSNDLPGYESLTPIESEQEPTDE